MQNRYTADIGDFAKYGLLRALSSVPLPLLFSRFQTGLSMRPMNLTTT